jgi:hypothetical protein
MSILSQIVESASATVPFDKAQPVRRYDKDYALQQQALAEQQLKEELAREAEDTQIEGFRKNKKRLVEEQGQPIKRKKKKPSFMQEGAEPREVKSQVKKINNLLSKICSGFDTKDGIDEEIIPKKKHKKPEQS